MKDLVTLVADKNMEYALRGLLERATALEIRDITYDAFVHPRRDPGCLNEAHDFLRPLHTVYRHALVVFDHQGCGREGDAPECVANEVRLRLERNYQPWPSNHWIAARTLTSSSSRSFSRSFSTSRLYRP